ncbi:PAS domain-containing protein [Ferrovibrio sp.]|uniref:PAS domain-containing protein n=1 Tax=Ferrovibrio sp. TaxID=1917215 RepID=UPI00311F2CD8
MKSPAQLPFADDRILLNLAAYWSGRRGGRPLPLRPDIDPLDMPRRLLPHLVLAEPLGDGSRTVRFRLVGTELVQRRGRDLTGKTSAEFTGDYRDYVEGLYAAVLDKGRPFYAETTRQWPEEGSSRVRRLLLPVGDGNGGVGFVLTAQSHSAGWTEQGEPPKPRQHLIATEALEKGVLQATLRGGLLD